ncbi:unnamed protein product [Mytilus edulis]|uniref:Uncharacterized protein n=1 Tax=Mytilus edulis TaxID=6550 RepID=A0A8S3TJQ5_MYTED|nr:unnamed protein product [Mytilus edulis]
MYKKTAQTDKHECLNRFDIRPGITVEDLDLSDLNFFLWNSRTLSTQEENSLKSIMSTRSVICHPPSSQIYSINELKTIWISLENDMLETTDDLKKCIKNENNGTKCEIDAKLSDSEIRVCQMVSRSQDIVAGKLDEVSKDNSTYFVSLMESTRILMEEMQTVIGLLGKQEVKLVGNPELIEQLAETSGIEEERESKCSCELSTVALHY